MRWSVFGPKVAWVLRGNMITTGTKLTQASVQGVGLRCQQQCCGSLVSKDLPSNGVYVGVPAVRICSIEEYRGKSEALLNSRPRFDDRFG